MSRFAAGYAGDTSTKGRILHALTTLITASENPSLVQAIGRFGGLIDYMHRRVTGELILSNPIPGNDFVDLVKGECEPLIKMALADLESVGENFGSVSFTPEECAQFDETVFVDVGDILYLRAVLKGLLGYAYWVRAYDQTVDYPALELDYNNPIDEHGRHRKLAAGSMVSHQQGLFGKLRTRGNLGTAKTLIREALVLVKRADQFCSARSDAALHLFEYDKMNEDQMSRVAALRSNIDTAIDSIDGGTRSFLWKGAFAKSKKEIFGLEDPLPVNLKAVFSGSFKRAMVPASFSSNRYAPNLDLMTDPTFGGIFPSFTTVAKWASLFVANGAVNTVDFYTSGIEPKFPVGTTLSGAFAPLKAKNGVAPYAGAVYDEDGSIVGVVSVKVSKRSVKQGIGSSKVMISVTMFGDKTYRTKSLKVPTGDVPQELTGGIAVGKLGTLINFFIADDGFEGTLRTDFGELKLETASVGGDWVSNDAKVELVDVDLSAIPGVVQTDLLPVGQQAEPIILKRGKWSFRKATSVKWSKPKGEVAKRLVVDETKNKTNRSGLKLTYTPKTGLFKGSFKLFALEGNGDKVKLKKYTVKVTGAVIDGIGYGSADLSKPHCRWKVLVK